MKFNSLNLTENSSKVLASLYCNKLYSTGYMQAKTIKEECDFEKYSTVIGNLIGLVKAGLVNIKTEELSDGTIFKFYYIPDKVFDTLIEKVEFEKGV